MPRFTTPTAVLAAMLAVAPATAAQPHWTTPFPARPTPALVGRLVRAGMLDRGRDAAGARPTTAWGQATRAQQARSLHAVVRALAEEQPPLPLAAAILTVAWVESGYNPIARNPHSTACGLFQFVQATWRRYAGEGTRCTDPTVNADVGVRYLTKIYTRLMDPSVAGARRRERPRLERIYRVLYAYHYHGIASRHAPVGGTEAARRPAATGLRRLWAFYAVLQRAAKAAPSTEPPTTIQAGLFPPAA